MTDKDISPSPSFQRFKPYPSYKDSGVDWLGKIPATWRSVRLRYVVLINPTKSEIQTLDPALSVSFVPMEALGESGGLNLEVTKSLGTLAAGYTYFRDNDVVVAKITPCFENGKGALAQGLLNGVAFGTTELHVLRPRPDVDPRFLFYLTLSDHFRRLGAAQMYGAAGQKRVPEDFILNFRHPLPSLEDQRLISGFLDCETTKIDALIAKKERLIELLQEKRTALITQAVTKGLDPNVPMKDSGIEWLGKIPAKWGLKRLKRIVEFRGGGTPSKDNLDYWRGNIPWVSPKDMKVSVLDDTEDKITPQAVRESATNLVPVGAVLIVVRSGILIHTIPVALTGRELTLNQDLKALIPRSDILPKYLFFLISGRQKELLVEWKKEGATVESLEMDLVSQTQIPLPDEGEQEAISAFLDRETANIDSLVIKINEAIDRLKEYRIALISAAVTGKIAVRKA